MGENLTGPMAVRFTLRFKNDKGKQVTRDITATINVADCVEDDGTVWKLKGVTHNIGKFAFRFEASYRIGMAKIGTLTVLP